MSTVPAVGDRLRSSRMSRLRRILGPGLVTGAADDDPSGIATYAQAGAQFGFSLGWTLLLTYPMMVVIQEISARLGRTTGHGIAGNLRRCYPGWVLQGIVALLCAANVLNIGADLGAMAAAAQLMLPIPSWLYVVAFGLVCTVGTVFLQYQRYMGILRWLTVSLLAYFGTLFVVHVRWEQFFTGLLWPHLTLDHSFWLTVVAIFGTTISPYLFFWQAAQEAEDTRTSPERKPLLQKPQQGPDALVRIRMDTTTGMAASNLVALAILVTTASTLHEHGITDVVTAAQVAESLRPTAGAAAFALFALGIIGTGLLSVPVLAGSAAYALAEALRWPVGLSQQPHRARAFYGTIVLATLLGALGNVFAFNPIKALLWAAVINGIVAVPVMAMLMLMSVRSSILGRFRIGKRLAFLGWTATGVMALASIVLIVGSLQP
jgi:NRAMP (natural resistance-associated macrophage protein)-like metal ion transporter